MKTHQAKQLTAMREARFTQITQVSLIALILCALSALDLKGLSATGLVEVSGGSAHILGGGLKSRGGGGVQLLTGLGGRPSWAQKGTALYVYAALSYDRLLSTGPVELGEPAVRREQLSLGLGARGYIVLKGPVRLWVGLGFDEVFENASLHVEGLEPHELSDQTLSVTGSVGLQYKVKPRLLLSLGYQLTRFGAQEQVGLIERAALISEGEGPWGRGRLSLGVTHIF